MSIEQGLPEVIAGGAVIVGTDGAATPVAAPVILVGGIQVVGGTFLARDSINGLKDDFGNLHWSNQAGRSPGGSTSEVGSRIDPLGDDDLASAVRQRRIDDGTRGRSGNYGAARLEDGTIITGRSGAKLHAEEDLIAQAGDRKIVDLYTERAPCAAKCQAKVEGANVTWAFRWNGATKAETDAIRATTTRDMKEYIKQVFK